MGISGRREAVGADCVLTSQQPAMMGLVEAEPGQSPPHQPFSQFNDFKSVGRANRPIGDRSMWALDSRRHRCSPTNQGCSCCLAPSGAPSPEFQFRDARYNSKMALIDGAWTVRPELKDPNNALLNNHSKPLAVTVPKPKRARPQALRREGSGFARFERLRESTRTSPDPWVPPPTHQEAPAPFTLPELTP